MTRIQALQWPEFLDFMKRYWQPGMHGAVVGPTGEGKTTFVKPLLDQRKYVMVLDPKGLDDTLEKYGYERLTSLPQGKLPRNVRKRIEDGEPARIIIGGAADSEETDAKLRQLMRRALMMAREQGGWTVYADELQVLGDREIYGLGKLVERMLITYRAKAGSVVTAFQAPVWVPGAAWRQCSWVSMTATRDEDMIKKVARGMGRNPHELYAMVQELPSFRQLVLTKNVRAPAIVVHPPKIG